MGRTPVKALNCSASSESLAVPDGQPWMERRARMICSGLTESGSGAAPTITNLPPGARPSIKTEMAQASDALDRDQIARPRTGISERVVYGDAGAKQGGGFLGRQFVGDRSH